MMLIRGQIWRIGNSIVYRQLPPTEVEVKG